MRHTSARMGGALRVEQRVMPRIQQLDGQTSVVEAKVARMVVGAGCPAVVTVGASASRGGDLYMAYKYGWQREGALRPKAMEARDVACASEGAR